MEDKYISKEQFYKIAHIRKSTALRLIREGLIPALETGETVKRYHIAMADVEIYLKDRERNPEKYGMVHGHLTQDFPGKYCRRDARSRSRRARQLWSNEPDLLTAAEAAGLLGYRPATILRWSRKGWIAQIRTAHRIYIPKKNLLAFVESRYFQNIPRKSGEHLHIMGRLSDEEV